ncbi:hypothetical protein ACS0TY_022267 [Phlomoides rotata]
MVGTPNSVINAHADEPEANQQNNNAGRQQMRVQEVHNNVEHGGCFGESSKRSNAFTFNKHLFGRPDQPLNSTFKRQCGIKSLHVEPEP